MLELFTIDLLADRVADDLVAGRVDRRLLHRFFRKGRADGRAVHDPLTVAMLLRDAVSLAGTRLTEEFLAHRERAAQDVAELERLARSTPPPAGPPASVELSLPPLPDEPLSPPPAPHTRDNDELLRAALERRRTLKKHRARQSVLIAAERTAAARRAEWLEREQEAATAREELARTTTALRELQAQYLERFHAVGYAGSLLWDRYCNGFERGHTVRRSRGSTVRPPRAGLVFEVPEALSADPWAGPSVRERVRATNGG